MSGLAGLALRKVMEIIQRYPYPAGRPRVPEAGSSFPRPFTRARIAGTSKSGRPSRVYRLSGEYVFSSRMRHARHRFWVYVGLGVLLLAYILYYVGQGILLRR